MTTHFGFDEIDFDYHERRLIFDACHREVGRRQEATGECWPLIRENYIQRDGTIISTSAYEPMVVARGRRRGRAYQITLLSEWAHAE
jgi:hypothetical protein